VSDRDVLPEHSLRQGPGFPVHRHTDWATNGHIFMRICPNEECYPSCN
jgi:hypothetical protein